MRELEKVRSQKRQQIFTALDVPRTLKGQSPLFNLFFHYRRLLSSKRKLHFSIQQFLEDSEPFLRRKGFQHNDYLTSGPLVKALRVPKVRICDLPIVLNNRMKVVPNFSKILVVDLWQGLKTPEIFDPNSNKLYYLEPKLRYIIQHISHISKNFFTYEEVIFYFTKYIQRERKKFIISRVPSIPQNLFEFFDLLTKHDFLDKDSVHRAVAPYLHPCSVLYISKNKHR